MTPNEHRFAESVSLKLADWITSINLKALPQSIRDDAKAAFIDWIACVVSGASIPESSYVNAATLALGSGNESSLFVFGGKTTAYRAALVHGTMAHSLDFDDTLEDSAVHTGASVCSAAFAVTEKEGLGGDRLLEGIVAGYEVAGRVGKASNIVPERGSSARGFHPAGTCGVFGATAAVAKVIRLDALTTARALGIAGSFASGIREYSTDGSMTKRIHPGLAASHGVLCVELARRGFTGPLTVFEGPNGFLRAYSETPQVHHLTDGLGQGFEITNRITKFYPCCHCSQSAIDVVIDFYRGGLRADQLKAVKVRLAPGAFEIVAHPIEQKRRPETALDAQLSLPYCLGVALVNGEVRPGHFEPEQLQKPIYRELAEKIEVIGDPVIDETLSHWGARVTISKKDGSVLDKEQVLPGSSGNTGSLTVAKLRELASGTIPRESIDRILNHIKKLENLSKVEKLGNLLASGVGKRRTL